MSNKFGPESTNPRQRRAYAHAMTAKALVSGKPEDKVRAVEVAAAASTTNKGKGLGEQTLRAFLNQYQHTKPKTVPDVHSIDEAGKGQAHPSWISPDYLRRYQAVTTALDNEYGVTIFKPETAEDYYEAAQQIGAGQSTEGNARWAQKQQNGVVSYDWSIPGTAFHVDAVRAVGWDTNPTRRLDGLSKSAPIAL